MANSRTKNSALIMAFSGMRQLLTFLLAFVSRTVFIYTLGAEYLGLNGLFTNILQFLSLTELGIGSAIAFYLYKPLAVHDTERVKVIMRFYRGCYRVVGLSMLGLGCLLMPFLSKLVNLDQPIPDNLYLIYFLFLCNSAFTYLFFAYKQTLVMANQEQYRIEKVNIAFTFINCLADVVILLLFRNFTIYLAVKVALVVVKNMVISAKIDKAYPYIKEPCSGRLGREEIKNLFKDVYSVSVFRVGNTLVNSVTNIIISACLGTIIVGYYSNYLLITSSVIMAFMLFVNSFTAGIGNVMATETSEKQYRVYKTLNLMSFFVYTVFTICLFQLSNSFINLWIGNIHKDYVLSQWAVVAICLNFYLDCNAQIINAFRNGSGHFKTGRYLPVYGGIANVAASLIGAKFFGLLGVLFVPPFVKAFITTIPFFILIGRDVFGKPAGEMLKDQGGKFLFTSVGCVLTWIVCRGIHQTTLPMFVVEIIMTVLIASVLLWVIYGKSPEFATIRGKLSRIIKQKREI